MSGLVGVGTALAATHRVPVTLGVPDCVAVLEGVLLGVLLGVGVGSVFGGTRLTKAPLVHEEALLMVNKPSRVLNQHLSPVHVHPPHSGRLKQHAVMQVS